MAQRKLTLDDRIALSDTIRRKRPLTLDEHRHLGEWLAQAEELLAEVYALAGCLCRKRELKPLENLITSWSPSPIRKVRSLLDDKLFAQFPHLTTQNLSEVYYGARSRLPKPYNSPQEVTHEHSA